MRTINVWRQIIAVMRHLAYPAWANESPVPVEHLILVDSCAKVSAEGWGPATKDTVPTMEVHGRTWYKGPPPHVGWWNASACPKETWAPSMWRWWDGQHWTLCRKVDLPSFQTTADTDCIFWNDYYPEDAVVPRMTPEQWKERARASS